jgi:23S rRNA (uracil1939-C5)-methyltransferase
MAPLVTNPNDVAPFVVDIEKLVHGGEGLARLDGQVILTPFVLPGEKVSLKTSRVKTGLLRGTISEIITPAPERVTPRCEYFGSCGGCHLQHAGYEFQLVQKQNILRETLQRLAGFTYESEIPCVSAEPWGYRNRVQLHFKNRKSGFHKAGSNEIQAISHCHIAAPILVEAIAAYREAVKKPEFPDFLRSLEIFTDGDDLQLNILDSNRPVAARFFDWSKRFLPPIASGAITYNAAGYSFRISRGSFFQTNRFLIEPLVNEVLGDLAGAHAADLYAGVGLFSLPLANRFTQVDAIERGGPAFRDLEWNATSAGLTNIRPKHASAEEFLRELTESPDLIVADPPRAGLGTEATKELLRLKPKVLLIVSCDPATLARDLKTLLAGGFAVKRISLVDLFPQTFHFETVLLLEKQN